MSRARIGNPGIKMSGLRRRVKAPEKFDLSKPGDIQRAADALAQGTFGLAHFGNIIGLFCEPSACTVGDMNEFKGSERRKPVSVTACIESLSSATADREAFSEQLAHEQAIAIAADFSAYGPVGFILPASGDTPGHLSVMADADGPRLKTVQVITAGDASPFNDFASAVTSRITAGYFAATSANISSYSLGSPQSVHYRMKHALEEFIGRGGDRFFVLAAPNERRLANSYPYHDARSTTILRLCDISRDDSGIPLKDYQGRYVLEVTRWGSMDRNLTEKVLAQHGYGALFPPERIGKRSYA